jgi:long-chain fatty acid transport protein
MPPAVVYCPVGGGSFMRHVHSSALVAAGALLAVALGAATARAQGYGLYEQGTCTMARGGAGVAAPCDDGSSMFFNPAGLALDTHLIVSAGVTGIAPRGTFTNSATGLVSSLSDKVYVAPTVYAAGPIGKRTVIGVGLFAPYGLTTDWPNTAEGRFLGYHSRVASIYVQPTVALRLADNLYVGGGIDITRTRLELRRRVDLAATLIPGAGGLTFGSIPALGIARGTDFADVNLTGTGNRVGAHVGVIVKASDTFSVGARYLSRQTVSIDNAQVAIMQIPTNLTLRIPLGPTIPAGTPIDRLVAGAFATGGPLSPQTATTSIPLPDQFVAGIAVKPSPRLRVLADYQYTHWKLFDQVTIVNQFAPTTVVIEQYSDTHGVRLGVDYSLDRASLRAGLDAHSAGAPDQSVTPLLPEAARWEVAGGVGVPFSPRARLDLAYMYVHQQDRAGRSTEGANNGQYRYYANLFSAQIVLRF